MLFYVFSFNITQNINKLARIEQTSFLIFHVLWFYIELRLEGEIYVLTIMGGVENIRLKGPISNTQHLQV